MLHGETGEDGAIREILELLAIPYVGATPVGCRAAFDKPVAKTVVTRAGLRTPESVCLPHETFRELGAADVMDALVERLGLPLMVKPARSGSALGCSVVATREAAAERDGQRLRLRLGRRCSSSSSPAPRSPSRSSTTGPAPGRCPPVGIRPDGGVYDYTARYTAGGHGVRGARAAVRRAERRVRAGRRRRPRGARPARPLPLRPDRRRRRHRVVPRGQRRPRASPRPPRSRCRSRPPGSTSATSPPPWSAPPSRGTEVPEEAARARPHLPAGHRRRQDRLPAARPASSR